MMSYFWDNKVEKIYRIKFGKKDSQEEFMDYITKLMIDNCWLCLHIADDIREEDRK